MKTLNRDSILEEAYKRCLKECYEKAQPSADFDKLMEGKKNGTIIDTKENPIYKRYYLSAEELKYIVNKYIDMYRMGNLWIENSNFILNAFKDGSYKDTYIKDDNGCSHREAEKIPPLKDIIGEDNAERVNQFIEDMQNFYRFDREASDFSCWVYLGGSPNSNKEAVIKYWKDKGVDITIEDRDPITFWYRDEYGDKWEEIYKEEVNDAYGN